MHPAIVEVGLNEAAPRALNPHVPYSAAECAADAIRCRDAGAPVVHWHARHAVTGEQRLDDARLYGEALAPMRRAGLLAYPSYPVEPTSLDARFGHCRELRERHGLEMAPVDVGSVSIVPWDEYHLRQLPPELDVAWVLVPYALSDARLVERLCRRALELGGGIRVGIGDTPAAFPEHDNARLVEAAVRWVEESGRGLASAADVRARLGLPHVEASRV